LSWTARLTCSSTAARGHPRSYALDSNGDRCIKKKLGRGAFLVPVRAAGQKYVILDAPKIGNCFKDAARRLRRRREVKKIKDTKPKLLLVEPSARQARSKRLTDDDLAEMMAYSGHRDHTNRRMAITRFAAWRSERSDVSLWDLVTG